MWFHYSTNASTVCWFTTSPFWRIYLEYNLHPCCLLRTCSRPCCHSLALSHSSLEERTWIRTVHLAFLRFNWLWTPVIYRLVVRKAVNRVEGRLPNVRWVATVAKPLPDRHIFLEYIEVSPVYHICWGDRWNGRKQWTGKTPFEDSKSSIT